MNTRIIDTADAVVRRYKTRNPEEIISQRAIKLKDIRCCRDLLGYYTVMLNCEYIGINPNCTPAEIAQANTIEKHFVDFKLNILAAKGYQLPVLPELHNDFLKDSMKNCEVTID